MSAQAFLTVKLGSSDNSVLLGQTPTEKTFAELAVFDPIFDHIVVADWAWGGTAKSAMSGPKVESCEYEPLKIWKERDDATTNLLYLLKNAKRVPTVTLTVMKQQDGPKKVFILTLTNPRLTEIHFETGPELTRREQVVFDEAQAIKVEVLKQCNDGTYWPFQDIISKEKID